MFWEAAKDVILILIANFLIRFVGERVDVGLVPLKRVGHVLLCSSIAAFELLFAFWELMSPAA